MGKIEIKKATKKAIKSVERSAVITEKAKDITIKTKDDIGKVVNTKENSPQEYASQRVSDTAHNIASDSVYVFNKIGYEATKKTIKDAPKTIEEIRERRLKKQRAKRGNQQIPTNSTAIAQNNVEIEPITKTKTDKVSIKTKQSATKQTKMSIKQAKAKKNVKKIVKSNPMLNKLSTTKFARASLKTVSNISNGFAKGTKALKTFFAFLKRIIAMAIKTTTQLTTALIGGAWVVVLIIIVFAIAGGVISSSYGIFLSNEESETGITMKSVVQELNTEFQQKLEEEKSRYTFDDIDIEGTQADWRDVLGVYAIKTNTDETNPIEIATIDENKKQLIKNVFWDMNNISSSTKIVEETETQTIIDADGNEVEETITVTKNILVINIATKTANDMVTQYGFSTEQKTQLLDLIADKNIQLWNALIYGTGALSSIDISSLDFTNENANEQQKKVCVVATNSTQYGVVADSGYCQAWVADIYQVAVGNRGYAASALSAGRMWSVSKDWSKIQVGATVYGYASNPFGHVGIYIGNGQVIHNLSGTITLQSLDSWVSQFKGICWGWENGKNLSGDSQYNCVGGLL